ncbi:MAG: toprim domain-containing protein [Catenulispora sp.]
MHPVVATDNDAAGRAAAARAYWLLTPHRLDPRLASLPTGTDPAELLARHGAAALTRALEDACPLADALVHERLTHPQDTRVTADVARIIAARPAPTWQRACTAAAATASLSVVDLSRHLLAAARLWNTDPRHAAQQALRSLHHSGRHRPALGRGLVAPPAGRSSSLEHRPPAHGPTGAANPGPGTGPAPPPGRRSADSSSAGLLRFPPDRGGIGYKE